MTRLSREEVESAWRQRLARFAQSAQTIEAFCRQERVSASSFYHWRQRLGQAAAPCTSDDAAGPFLELGAVTAASPHIKAGVPAGMADLTIRFDLPGGMVVTIARS